MVRCRLDICLLFPAPKCGYYGIASHLGVINFECAACAIDVTSVQVVTCSCR